MSLTSIFAPVLPYLPQHEGYLPKWLLLVSVISFYNTIQSYLSLSQTARVYCGPYPLAIDRLPFSSVPPKPTKSSPATKSSSSSNSTSPATPLSSRTFGTWTLLTSLVRLYAAYNITNPAIYQLAIFTYGVAWWHFMSEWLVFRSTSWGKGLLGPVMVANLSLGWMVWEWGFYVGK